MKQKVSILLMLIIAFGGAFAQDNIGLKANITRFDQYLVADYNKDFTNKLNGGFELGLGLNSTIFGASFRPLVGLYIAYELVKKEKFRFQPLLSFQGHFLQLDNQRLNFSDLNFGYNIEYGSTWKVYQQALVGYGLQWLKQNNSLYLNINFNLGLRYEL